MDASSNSASLELMPEHQEPRPPDEDQGWYRSYTKLAKLGEGGCAEVFKARDGGERIVALKISKTGVEELRRFKREIEVLSGLRHRNVVELLESGDGWYVMPLAEGNLTELAAELSDEERIELVAHIAAGLGAAHAREFTHRDVTPNNMLRMRDGDRVYWAISDFGMVKRPPGQSSVPATKRGLGTVGFMAPEVAILGGHEADHRADIYGLGRTIEFMTTGTKPVFVEPIAVPPIWEPLVSKMTCHLREERFQQMAEVSVALDQVRARLKAQRRASFGTAVVPTAPPQPQEIELGPQELVVLRSILSLTTGVFTEFDLRRWSKQTIPRRTLAIGLIGLRDRGFLTEVLTEQGNPCEYLSESAKKWVLAHRNEVEPPPMAPQPEALVEVEPPTDDMPPPGDDDAPF
jgi:serine/threonine protein kinase